MIHLTKVSSYYSLDFFVSGKLNNLIKIGRGSKTTAYRKEDRVFLFVPDEDHSKEILSNCYSTKSRTFPKITYLGDTKYKKVYETTYSETISAKNHFELWKIKKELEKTRLVGWNKFFSYQKLNYCGYEISNFVIENANVPSYIKIELQVLLDSMANYGQSWCFEFTKRNIGVRNNKIQFRDCCFDIELYLKKENGYAFF